MAKRAMDMGVLLLITIVAAIITFAFRVNLLVSVLLFFGLPVLYLICRRPAIFRKSVAFSLLMSVPLSMFIDTIAAVNGSWVVSHTVFPIKLFGVATLEVYIYGLLWVLYAVLLYEHWFDERRRGEKISPRIWYLIGLSVGMVSYTIVAFSFDSRLLVVSRFYLLVGIVLVIIPLVLFLVRYPHFIKRYVQISVFFFAVMFTFELAALHANQWSFPAKDFLGFIAPFGYRFPIEEFVFWIVAGTGSLLAYYEFFADDQRL